MAVFRGVAGGGDPAASGELLPWWKGLSATFVDSSTGKVVLEGPFERVERFSEGVAVVYQNSRAGYIDRSGRFAIQPRFEAAESFVGGLAWAVDAETGMRGIIDLVGEWVVRPAYDDLGRHSSSGLFRFVSERKVGFITIDGVERIPASYDFAQDFSEGLAGVAIRDPSGTRRWGFIDTQGNQAIPLTLAYAGHFVGGLADVLIENESGKRKGGFVNRQGDVVITGFHVTMPFAEGRAAVAHAQDGPFGFIDVTGKLVIPADYESVRRFSEGLAAVKDEETGLWGYIDRAGDWVITPRFDAGREFKRGYALVRRDDSSGYIDRKGYWVTPRQEDQSKYAEQRRSESP